MDDTFYYIGSDIVKIQGKNYVCLYILNIQKKVILKIYKPNNEDLQNFLSQVNYFDEITSFIRFAIKRDGRISLDILF